MKEGKNASLIISSLTAAIITQSLLRAATIVFEFIQINFIILADGIPLTFFLFIFLKNYLFIYFWPHCVFIAACGLSLVAVSGGYSSLRCAGFSWWWLLLLRSTGCRSMGFSSCDSWALECRLSSCGARA